VLGFSAPPLLGHCELAPATGGLGPVALAFTESFSQPRRLSSILESDWPTPPAYAHVYPRPR